jgi:hypothetical protein
MLLRINGITDGTVEPRCRYVQRDTGFFYRLFGMGGGAFC